MGKCGPGYSLCIGYSDTLSRVRQKCAVLDSYLKKVGKPPAAVIALNKTIGPLHTQHKTMQKALDDIAGIEDCLDAALAMVEKK